MSSTNVQLVGGQTIPNLEENEMEIPPKASGRGPSSLEVKTGKGIEIPVGVSELHKNGQLIAKDGTQVAKFDAKAFRAIVAKHNKERQSRTTKSTSLSREEGR